MNNVCGAPCNRKVMIPHCSADSVVEYRQSHDLRDFVWMQKSATATQDVGKVADFVAKRRQSEGAAKAPAERSN